MRWRQPVLSLVTAILLAACAASPAGPSDQAEPIGAASASPTSEVGTSATPSRPLETPGASAEPASSTGAGVSPNPAVALLEPWQTARVRVNGLAVRRGPDPLAPLVAAYRYDVATSREVLVTDAVRLNDGYFLWIEDGPLVIEGVPWYHVGNSARQGEPTPESSHGWDADGDEFRSDYGWVAGGDGTSAYLVADEPPPPPPDEPVYGSAPDPYALMHAIGDARSETFELDAPVGIRWYGADPEGGSCRLTIMLEPLGVELLARGITGWDGGDDWWPKGYDYTEPLPAGAHWVEVQSDCSWSLRVVRIIG
jgi:hypothetical protein